MPPQAVHALPYEAGPSYERKALRTSTKETKEVAIFLTPYNTPVLNWGYD